MIDKVKMHLDEHETIINVDPVENIAYYYSTIPSTIKKMYKLLEEHPDEVKLHRDDKYGLEIKVPIKWVKVTPPRRYSEEQKAAMRERVRAIGKNK